MKKQKYEVLICSEWITTLRAEEQGNGWLHYELHDGINGLAQRKNWRIKQPNQQKKQK